MSVFSEDQFISGEQQSGISHVYGLDFDPSRELSLSMTIQTSNLDGDVEGIERNAVSLSGHYKKDRLDAGSKLEYRKDRGDENKRQWLTTNGLRYQLSDSFTGLGKLNFSISENRDTGDDDGRFAEFDAGMAYRPVDNDRFNMLGKYTFQYDLDSSGQADADTDEKSHVLSLEGLYDLTRCVALGSKLAWKRGEVREDRDQGKWFHTVTRLAVIRSRYHITSAWDVLVGYRWLDVDEAEDNRQGVLLGIDRHINDNFKVAIGCNFTGFNDDLTNLDYKNHGWFVNFVGKY